jgi:hypothetical protein
MPDKLTMDIPSNIMTPLEVSGLASVVLEGIPYANGVMTVLMGKAENDGNIITQNMEMAMKNTGLTIDDLTRYLFSLEDNLRGLAGANPAITEPVRDFYRTVYFAMFMEYLKIFSIDNKYYPPQYIMQIARRMNVTDDMFANAVNVKAFNDNMYALSLKNPGNITQPQISPWIFVYNDDGNTHLFLTEDEMAQYDKKYGKGLSRSLRKLFDRDHIKTTGVAIAAMLGIGIVGTIFIKKHRDRKREEEKETISQIEADAREED